MALLRLRSRPSQRIRSVADDDFKILIVDVYCLQNHHRVLGITVFTSLVLSCARTSSSSLSHSIDLLIQPPCCSHELQPLDIGVFVPLKRALARETDESRGSTQWTKVTAIAEARVRRTATYLHHTLTREGAMPPIADEEVSIRWLPLCVTRLSNFPSVKRKLTKGIYTVERWDKGLNLDVCWSSCK